MTVRGENTMKVHVFLGRTFLAVGDAFYEVELYNKNKKLKKDFGYIMDDGYVYIYRGKKEDFTGNARKLPCGIYRDGKEYEYVPPKSDEEKEKYSVDNVVDFDPNRIFNEVTENKEDFVDTEDIEYINNNGAVFKVELEDNDDFLKRGVKEVINRKGISLDVYKPKSETKHSIPNLKTTVQKKNSSMTIKRFLEWADLLQFDWEMVIRDGGDNRAPLKEPIVLKSDEFK